MNRRKARENAFVAMFAAAFGEDAAAAAQAIGEEDSALATDAFGEGLIALYQQHAQSVDKEIESRLKGWDVKRIQKVNLALLRLAVAEMLYGAEADLDSVIINEAVELAKKYGDENDYQFVNGLLGSVARDKGKTADAPQEDANGG